MCQVSSVSFFWNGECGRIKNGKYQLLKIDKSRYVVISLKLQKGLELVSSLKHWVKNMLEMFFIRYTSIWTNFILIVMAEVYSPLPPTPLILQLTMKIPLSSPFTNENFLGSPFGNFFAFFQVPLCWRGAEGCLPW